MLTLMKKFLIYSTITILVLIGAIAFIAKTQIGQKEVLLPVANTLLKEKVKGHSVVLDSINPSLNSISFSGVVDNSIIFRANGPINWLKLAFDLKYQIEAKRVELNNQELKLDIHLAGDAKGDSKRIDIKGRGEAFESNLTYSFMLIDGELSGIKLNMKEAKVSQILALYSLPPYIRGRLNLDISLPKPDIKTAGGRVSFLLKSGKINYKLLSKAVKYSPKDSSLKAQGSLELKGKLLSGKAYIQTPFAKLSLSNFYSTPALKVFKSRYKLDISSLRTISRIFNTRARGKILTNGSFYFNREKKTLQVEGVSQSFGGKLAYIYESNHLSVVLNRVDINKILYYLIIPNRYIEYGKLSGKALIKDFKTLNLDYNLAIAGKWKKRLFVSTGMPVISAGKEFYIDSRGNIKNSRVKARANYRDSYTSLELLNTTYTLKSKEFKSQYSLKLRELSSFTKGSIRGKFKIAGKISYISPKKRLYLDGKSRSFGGVSKIIYNGRSIKLSLDSVNLKNLLWRLREPNYLAKGRIDAKIDIDDILHKRGSFSYSSNGILKSQTIKKRFNLDIPKGFQYSLNGKGDINGDSISSSHLLKTEVANLNFKALKYNLDSKALNGVYRLSIPNLKRLKAIIKRELRGSFVTSGKVISNKKIGFLLDGGSKALNGKLHYSLKRGIFTLNLNHISIDKLLYTLEYPPFAKGYIFGKLIYNTKSKKGNFAIPIKRLQLKDSPLIQTLSLLTKRNLVDKVFQKSHIKGDIKGDLILFDALISSTDLRVSTLRAKYNMRLQTIDSIIRLKNRDKIYKVRVKGSISHPRVIPIMTNDLQKKIGYEIKKHHLDKAIPKEIQDIEPVQELIKSIF